MLILISLWTHTDFDGIFKIIQVYERNKMQIEQHWVIPQTVPYSVQKKIGNNKYCEERTNEKNGKVRFRLNNDVRKEMEDSKP